MSLELLNRRDDDVAWLALARSSNVSEEVARLLWARAKAESNQDSIKAERLFRRLLEDTVTIDKLARELEANGDGGLLDPGKWTRVLDLSSTLQSREQVSVPAPRTAQASSGEAITDQMRKFAKSDAGRMIGMIDSGAMQQLIRMVDALVTIVEHERAAQEGKPLPANIRSELEDKLGIDFSDVRVHDNSKAAAEASKHDAVAFARGKDVYFADGAYNPSSLEGKKLIAHEVTHVAQQRGGGRAASGAMSEPGSAVEREADRVADAFGAGAARGSAAFRVQERAAAGTISRSGGGAPAAGADGDKKPTKWKPQLFNQALDLSEKLSLAKDIGGGHKEIEVNQNIGPLKIAKAQFKTAESGDKIESGTLHAAVDAGFFKGSTGQLKVDQNEGVTGKVNVPISASGMFAKEVNLEVGNGEITGKVRLDPSDFKSPHFTIKNSDFELSVTSKGGNDIGAALIGTGQVAIENGFAQGLAQLDIDLKVHREQGVTFNARVAGKVAVAGLGEAGAEIFWDGTKLTFNAGGTAPINIPGLEGIANFKYELGKLSLSSDSVRFTLPKLRPVAFSGVELGGESKLKAHLDLESPILIPLPGGASIELTHSSISIDGKKVEGDITGQFALNNAGGFKGEVNVGYTKEGGFKGRVGIAGGATFKVAGVSVTIENGSKLDIEKGTEGFNVAGDLKAKAKIPGLPEINVAVIAEHEKPIDLTVDTHVDISKITPQLKGDVHVTYQRGGGANSFHFDATDIGVKPAPLNGQVIFSQMSGHLQGGELTGSLTAAAGTEIMVGKTTKITIMGGHIDLLPGKILDGHLKAKGEGSGGGEGGTGGTQAEATIGWNQGKFDWAAEGNFELKDLTNDILRGSVHASAGSNGTGNFVSNGPIEFGNPLLKDVTIEHLSGNKEENHYEATVSIEKAINKVLTNVPSVKVEAAKAAAVITYKDKKLSVNGEIGLKARYPATGEPQLEGTILLGIDKDTGGFIGQMTGVNVKAGKYFESHGGHVDLKTGDVTLGLAKFEVPNMASGTVNHAHVNVKDKTFTIDLDVDLKAKALEGVKLNAHVDNDKITASLRENTPPIALGTFATVKISDGSNFEFGKETGFTASIVATVDAPSVGTGTARLNYDKKLTGSAELDVKQFAMFAPTKVHLNFDEQRTVSTVEPIKIELAEQYQTNFVASAEIVVDHNAFSVTGKVSELKNLGSVSEAFSAGGGAQINYDSKTKRVTMDANIAVDKVVKQLGPGSTLHMAYADNVVTIDGVLKPGNIGGTQVVFSPTSQINAHWDSKTKRFTTVGGAQATIADLCDVDFTVDMALGGGQPGQFGLRGRIEAGKLAAKIPGISFSAVTADFSLLIAAGQKSDLDFNLRAGINGIPAAGINDVDGYIQANFKTGQGINGEFGVNHAKLGPVIADGKISIERGKFKQGSLHMVADFPKLKIEGTGTVSASEMGGLNTTADLTVTPSPETAIGKFIQSGNIHVDLVKWKVTNALGKLNLVPPSFLPLVNPVIEVGYKPEEGIHACLKTQFPAPMAKNGELGNFEAGYSQGRGLYAHVDFPIQVPGFQTATVTGDLDKDGVKIGVDLIPKNAGLINRARVEVGYGKENGFYVEGKIRLKPTETLELELGLRYDSKGLQVIGITPDDKDANNEDHELAKKKFPFPTIPLLTVGVATLGLKFGMEIAAGYRMPKIKFKNPQLEGGLEALDSGGMPSFTFGGSIAMGAYVSLALSVQVVGEIQLLICSASAGIGAEIMARLNLELGADVNGRYASGQGAMITIDPYIAASLDLIASLIATLHAEIGWWTILDKKWTLASATFAHIDLGTFKPFKPIGLGFGGPQGTRLTTGMELNDGAFDSVTTGVKEGGKKSADSESNRETREKLTPVLQSFKNAAPQFAELPPGWEKGMVAAPVDFQSMFPVEDKKWDVYQDHADQAEDMVPELRMSTPTERLAKAVAVTARKNPYAAGRLILGWRRAQIAAKGINPDTGVDVVNERLIVQALIDAKYEKDVADAQEKQRLQDEEHAQHVVKQTSDFGKAESAHTQVAVQQQVAHDQSVTKIQSEWDKAQEKKAVAGKAAAQEGANVKPVQEQKAPPPPKPPAPPKPAPLGKPAPIPVPPKVPMPPPKEVLPAVTLPALPDDPGVSVKAAGVIPPQKKKVEPQSPGKKEPQTGGVPNPQPGATAGAATQAGGGGGSPMPSNSDSAGGAGPQVGGTTSSVPPPGPRVVAGPDGIISQNKTIDGKHSKYDPSFKGAGGGGGGGFLSSLFGGGAKPAEAAPGGAAPGAAKDGKAAPGAPGGDAANKDPKAAGKPGAAPGLDPTVQKVVDAGKAEENKQKQTLDNQKKTLDDKVKQNNKKTEEETKKLDAAAAEAKKKKEAEKAAAAAAAQKSADADALKKKGDGKDDKKPKGPIGTRIAIDILGEPHTLYIDEVTGVPMVEPPPTPLATKLAELKTAIGNAPPSIKNEAASIESSTEALEQQLEAVAKKAAAGDASALAEVTSKEQAVANSLKVSWAWAKVSQEPAVTGGSIEKPLLHPYYTQFKARVQHLNDAGHLTVDVGPFAESIWIKICDAVKKASPQMNDPKAYSDFAKGWLNMMSPEFKKAMGELDHIGKELAKAGQSAFAKADSFGFWSKDEGRSLAERVGGLTLETSAIGTLMDGLPTLDGKTAGWDPEIWGALSNAYATAVVPEVIKGKKIKVCIGAGVPAGNIWDAVESVALKHGLKQAGIELDHITTHYAAAALAKNNRKALNDQKVTGGIKGCLFVGDRPGAIAAADAYFKTCPEEFIGPLKQEKPTIDPTAKANQAAAANANQPPPSNQPKQPAAAGSQPGAQSPAGAGGDVKPSTSAPASQQPPQPAQAAQQQPPGKPGVPETKTADPKALDPNKAPDPAKPAAPPGNEKSKYGVGPAPAGWQGRVRGTTPSDSVAPDDPGHTYHILDDDKVVATTEPQLLAPHSKVSLRATQTKPKSEQLIIAESQRFEIRIGNRMANIANGAVQGLMKRINDYYEVKVKDYAGDAAKVEAELKKLGGDLAAQWAGRLPRDMETIVNVLNGHGNIREAITLFNNFVDHILKSDLKSGLAKEAMHKLLPEVQALPGDSVTRNQEALKLYTERRAAAKAKVAKVQGEWNQTGEKVQFGHQDETRKDSHQTPVVVDVHSEHTGTTVNPSANPIAGAQHQPTLPAGVQVPTSDNRYDPKIHADPTKKAATRENDDWWMHEMTVEEFTRLGGVLSEREKKLFNEGVYRRELAKRKDSIKDEASLQKAIAEAEAEAKKYVPWAAGFMGYDLHWDSANKVNQAFKELSTPVGAGVSGTTARTMDALMAVGIDPVTGLKICLGYLLPIQAHSFSEVRTAAQILNSAAGPYTPARGSHNYNQAPLKAEIEGMPEWAEFDRLFSPAAIGDKAAT